MPCNRRYDRKLLRLYINTYSPLSHVFVSSLAIRALCPLAFALAVASISHCSFVQYSEDEGLGLFAFESSKGGCKSWQSWPWKLAWLIRDGKFKAARFGGVMTALLTGLGCAAVFALSLPSIKRQRLARNLSWLRSGNDDSDPDHNLDTAQ